MEKGMHFRHIKYKDRVKIEALAAKKTPVAQIAEQLGFSRPTLYAELKRGQYQRMTKEWEFVTAYSADIAQDDYDYKASAKGPELKIGNDIALATFLEEKVIKGKCSPYAAVAKIKQEGKTFKTSICSRTMYNYIYRHIFLHLTSEHLPRRKAKRPYHKVRIARVKRPLCTSIEERPKEIDDRLRFGDWEMDTVIGKAKGKGQVLLVLTERLTRQEIIIRLKDKTEASVIKALDKLERKLGARFKRMFKTITIDNGAEFLDSEGLERSCRTKRKRTKVYYCHPSSSWERGSNENANSLIRRFIPKGTRIENYTDEEIQYIENWINNYPRKIFDARCSNDLYRQYVSTG